MKNLTLTSIAPPEWLGDARLAAQTRWRASMLATTIPAPSPPPRGARLAAWLAARAAGSRAARMEESKCAVRGAAAALGRRPEPIGASRLPLQPCSLNISLLVRYLPTKVSQERASAPTGSGLWRSSRSSERMWATQRPRRGGERAPRAVRAVLVARRPPAGPCYCAMGGVGAQGTRAACAARARP